MKGYIRVASACAIAAAASLTPAVVRAHFKLIEPASWQVSDDRGDPQKAAPCGAAQNSTPTNTITKVTGGSKLHLKVQETIYHPGHYRVALAVNSRAELPADPYTFETMTDRGPRSLWAAIQSPPQIPVIADGLFQHYTRPAAPAGAPAGARPAPQTFETDIQLPNINCPKCTLQIIQFMADHAYNQPGGYSYHHCAELAITADASKPIDKGWPSVAAPTQNQ
jgi:hypothetical protein